MKTKKIVSVALLFCLCFFTLTGCSKKLNADQISYKDQIITLGMEKSEIDALLGEGIQEGDKFLSINKTSGKEIQYINIKYDDITITYMGYIEDNKLFSAYIYIYARSVNK